ncbi:hypothetical protein JTE90_022527 [Oedothorax gibbosus]|uniref:Uncharacterized protein n=1 Tax=Oedothorax gibbosus TaxID=931172 RepID=A0AAV6UZ92_9ARAC|nr:hypothetical protein JTE90_022527 [Oedothorax gibbosus]
MKSPPIYSRNKELIAKGCGKHSVSSLVFKEPLSDNTMKTLPKFILISAGLFSYPNWVFFGHQQKISIPLFKAYASHEHILISS